MTNELIETVHRLTMHERKHKNSIYW